MKIQKMNLKTLLKKLIKNYKVTQMNILVIRFSSLGDLVTLEPAFRAVKYFYPNANITFVTSNIGKGLYEDTGYFDEFVVHKEYKETLHLIKQRDYELVFNFHCNSLYHKLVFFLTKSKVVNSAANMWQKLIGIKVPVKPVPVTLESSGISKVEIDDYFNKHNNNLVSLPVKDEPIIQTNKKLIAISTGSSEFWKSKQWGVKRYIRLIETILKEHDVDILLVGTSLELEDSNTISKQFPSVINYVDRSNLTQLKNLLCYSDMFIGNDSGPAHIAASVGTNTITIFGPTSTVHCVKYAPYKAEHVCLKPKNEISCHPCYKGTCPTSLECMESISVEEVYSKVKSFLRN